ncbi:hypothetical protein GBV73_08690 [Thermococcus sp. 101 C5]|nr:hypothetical protein [Thermococcus sp. 101 C5]
MIPSGDHDNHLKEFSKNPNKGYYKHALFAATSGRLFWGRKIKRNTHKLIALSAVLLLTIQIMLALYLYVL